MGLFRGIGARKDSVRGTSPIEVRKVLAGLFASTGGISARPGILPGGTTPLVTGNSTWAYNVGLFHAFTSYSAGDGGQVYGNDSAVLIGATGVGSTIPIAPGTGLSRIDVIWTRHPTNTENTDTSSEPLFGVASGTAASTPTAPTIPTGALELGRNTMTSAATNTLSAGNTITQSALFTALRGAPVPVRNQAERDALTLFEGQRADRLDLHVVERYNGTAWGQEQPTGAIIMFGGATAPAGYLNCDGASLLRTTYSALFTAIGVAYGSVDGTHFTLPNFASAFPRGNTPASNGGEATHVLTAAEMPSHTHITPGRVSATGGGDWPFAMMSSSAGSPDSSSLVSSAAGGGAAHNNLPPYIGVNFIIKT